MCAPKIAVFAGSFDPLTLGHENIIERALPLFDKIVVAIGTNSEKKGMFPVEIRRRFIERRFAGEEKIEVDSFQTLTVDYCRAKNARYILRGIRTAGDLDFEQVIADANRALCPDIESVFLLTEPRYGFIRSTVVRDILLHGGSCKGFVSEPVRNIIETCCSR